MSRISILSRIIIASHDHDQQALFHVSALGCHGNECPIGHAHGMTWHDYLAEANSTGQLYGL